MLKILVKRKALLSALAGAKAAHPNEFICLLIGKATKNSIIIKDTLVPPGIMVSETSSSFNDWMFPAIEGLVGTFHSHPKGSPEPSEQDRWIFSQKGGVHLIASAPYSKKSVSCYLGNGVQADFFVVD
ncbi:MAG: Mov34/MPN/PAD-1 family protein [Candidatus Micrarchaeota archaeon]|nr:Mov34/MPN/PAD-1 family protein [Candidatus Micrarchaeota archaeon]